MNTVNTITHRGIVCIDTFPLELVWSKKNTVLECSNCLTYATFKNVLVGLCINCASYSYNGKYGDGFYNFPYSSNNIINTDISLCFGNIHPLHILNIEGLEYKQSALNNCDSYTIYNLSLSSKDEISLLSNSPFNMYGLNEFQNYYHCDIEVLMMILSKVKELKLSFAIWNNEYYSKCLKVEHFFKVSEEDYKLQNEIANENNNNSTNKLKYPCNYCNIYKLKTDLKKCSRCKNSRYCSVACQTRDWKNNHSLDCKQEQEQEQDLGNYARKDNSEQDLENPARNYDSESDDYDDDFSSNHTIETDMDDSD